MATSRVRASVVLAVVVFLGASAPLCAAIIEVDGVCTLVDAITAAETDAAVGNCPAGFGQDEIRLLVDVETTFVNNTILGPNGLPKINSEIVIRGNHHQISRAVGASDFRLFIVDHGGYLELIDTTLSNGPVPVDDGGPTLTHALLAGDCGLSDDQRGFHRHDSACDSGSYELSGFDPFEIFEDGFESGGIKAWYRVVGADCALAMSQVPDCDFDQGLGGWIGSPAANVYSVDDDSDGVATSGAVEMVVDPSASMTLCFPKKVPGQTFITGIADVKVMSGSISSCWAEATHYTGTSCSGQTGWMQSFFLPASALWEPHWLGGMLSGDSNQSMRVTLRCSGDAIVRFDDVIKTHFHNIVAP